MKGLFRTILSIAAFAFIATGLNTTAFAADGDLDTTFGTGGKVMVDFDGNPTPGASDQDTGLDMVIQNDGKIIIVGETAIATTDSVMSATRLNADGTLDTTFGTNGRFMFNANVGISERAYGVIVQSDGKILITGRDNSPRSRYVLRLNADGTFDLAFGVNGVFKTAIGSSTFDEPELAVQTDGKIIVVGSGRNGGLTTDAFSVIRLTADGVLDTTFDGDGEAVTVFQSNDRAYGVELQPDGKIVVSGSFNNNGGMALARYNTDGSLDTSFDTDGKVTTTFPSSTALMYDLVISPNGRITGAGYIRGQHADAALIRFNTDGSLDTTFGTAGSTRFGTTVNEIFWDLQIKGGKIIGIGNRAFLSPAGPDDYMMVRYHIDGVLDTSFGTAGVIYTDFGSNRDLAFAGAFQADGKLVLAGYSTAVATFNPDFSAARFNFAPKDATVDFDGDGKSDAGIMRASGIGATYQWWIKNSGNGAITTLPFGVRPRDIPVPADYDGDGKDDIALWRNTPQTGEVCAFYIYYSSTGALDIIPFGQTGDTPTVEDYDGDGKDDLSVWRAPAVGSVGQATWYYRGTLNNPDKNITYVLWGMRWGSTQSDNVDDPYPGDFDGDGKADFAVQRLADTSQTNQSNPAAFHILTAKGVYSQQFFGWKSDRVLPGDYDGDGKTDIAVARGFNVSPGNTTWYIRYSSGIPDDATVYGSGFNFAQGDYDGDGKTDIAYLMTGFVDPEMVGFWYLASSNNRESRLIRWGQRPAGVGAIELPLAAYNNR